MTKTDNSFFGRYFRYKLGQSKPAIIIFALFNLLTAVVLPHYLLASNYNYSIEVNPYDPDELLIIQSFYYSLKLMFFAAIVGIIMITLTSIRMMNIYHDKAATDTLGSLPLSYRERFWGDILSSMFVNFVSFVPSFFISAVLENLVFRNIIKQSVTKQNPGYSVTVISHSVTVLLLVIMISYIGTYAVTAFVKSCCGRFGTAVLFSFVAMAVISGIYAVYANYFYSYSVGLNLSNEVCSKIGLLPPFGFIFSLTMRALNSFISQEELNSFDYLINRPVCFIVPALIIAAFLIGAYYVGKKRKAEKTGEGFVFKSVFYVLLITFLVMVFGFTGPYFFGEEGPFGLFLILLTTFVLYFALEFSQHKSFKGAWKIVVKYAAVAGVCVAFLSLVRATEAFGFYKRLPSENSIKEIRVSGDYVFYEYGSFEKTEHIYRSADSISAILNEHKKLLEEDGLETGYKLNITYVTKLGQEINRGYTMINDDEPIKNFSSIVNSLQKFDPNVLGIIGRSNFSNIEAEYERQDQNGGNLPSGHIRSEKTEELAKILRSDIENYYRDDSETGENDVGKVMFYDFNRYGNFRNYYRILDVYEATVQFLNDPGNYVDAAEEDPVSSYHVFYNTDGAEGLLSDLAVTVSEDDGSEYAKELLSYIEIGNNSNDHSPPCFIIYDSNGYYGYSIGPENEQAALKAMIGLFREKYVQ